MESDKLLHLSKVQSRVYLALFTSIRQGWNSRNLLCYAINYDRKSFRAPASPPPRSGYGGPLNISLKMTTYVSPLFAAKINVEFGKKQMSG